MNCRKCHKELMTDWTTCPWCGTSVAPKAKKSHRRSNGEGSIVKRGDTWQIRVTAGWDTSSGHAVQVRKVKGGFKSKAEAVAYLPKFMETAAEKVAKATFSELYDMWYAQHEDRVGKTTMDCYKAAYKHCKPLHHRKFDGIIATELQACIDDCPAGKRTKENIKALLSLMYRFAMTNDMVTRNKAETLYTGNDPRTTRPPLTMEELRKIYHSNEPYKDYVVAMCYLGYRPTEMLQMRKEAYDPVNKCLVGGIKTEAGKNRIVTIPPFIQPIVDAQLQTPGPFLWPRIHDNQKMTENYFRKFVFDPMMEHLGIEDRTPYSCRHTYANLLKGVQGSDTDKASLMGHSDASMTKYYQSADYDSIRAITDSLKPIA